MQSKKLSSGRSRAKFILVLLSIIAIILIVASLRATRAVSMPLAFAFLIAILVNPLQTRLERRLPQWLSLAIVLSVIAAVLGVLIGAIDLSLELIEPKVPGYIDRFQQIAENIQSGLANYGFSFSRESDQLSQAMGQVVTQAIGGLKSLLGAVSLLILIFSFLALLLLEVKKYAERTHRAFPERAGNHIIHAVSSMSRQLRRYFLVMAFTSVITGILTAFWCLILNVDLAVVWGLIAFVLNFIPTLGSIVAVIVPSFVAVLFHSPGTAIATLVGLAVLQVVIGNFVDPKLQGKYLKLSPFVALVSIVFWGWVWGIPGAFIGVPMTAAIVLFTHEFEPTRPIAVMLGDADHQSK
ncbi:AI-2E family transporter [Lyngbya sp. CCY1209]|uniref:AI-2E family transporter n=1 Tax=Lyngbya sp. CCY1209 TaxID=2886103 RepID=UPI002D20C465|nr:AI-2E family transporter [Lyngbya sp. CCY1209]MEB3887034.1 AI-2E family transporter [Lyngbya sp. CCY1209]